MRTPLNSLAASVPGAIRALQALAGTGLMIFAGAASAASAKDYATICESGRLVASQRAACRRQMEAATSDAERAKIWRVWDLRIAGFNPDGTRIKK